MDFLTDNLTYGSTPELPTPTLPYVQFNHEQEVFELSLTRQQTNDSDPQPHWSAILDGHLEPQTVKHNGNRTLAYTFDSVGFAVLATCAFWYDREGKVPGYFVQPPSKDEQKALGARFGSKLLVVGLIREVEALVPGTLCYLTTSGMAAKFLGQTLRDFEAKVLLPAHHAREDQLRAKNPDLPKATHLYFPSWAFWCELKAGESVNVSPQGITPKHIPPMVGTWSGKGATVEDLRKLYVPKHCQQAIQDTHLPDAERWVAAKQATLKTSLDDATVTPAGSDIELDIMPADDIPF